MNDRMSSRRPNETQKTTKEQARACGFALLDDARFPEFQPGTVWLIGAGPGAPGLMTLMGYHGLQQADAVIYDALVNADILKWARSDAQIEYAGKRGGKPSPNQKDISLRLIELARSGKRVLRLKGGDPFIFGRGGEECQMLAEASIPFRIVPGITSGIGGLAYAGIPATHRDTNHSVIFMTGHDSRGVLPESVDWKSVATASPVIVMYMAVRNLNSIARKLISFGRDPLDPVAIASNVSLPNQSVYETTLSEASKSKGLEELPTPAIVVIGKVVGFREDLDWYANCLRENKLG